MLEASFERFSLRLDDEWRVEEIVDDEVDADGLRLKRAGITAVGPGEVTVTGSAAEFSRDPLLRAWCELLERASIFTATSDPARVLACRTSTGQLASSVVAGELCPPTRDPCRAWSRSNGVALAREWSEACARGRLELVERDRVLRSWYGEARVEPLALAPSQLPATRSYAWRVARIPPVEAWNRDVEVAAVIAFGRKDNVPLLRGFGAARDLSGAIRRAIGECVQGLAFLTEGDIPAHRPPPAANTLFHLDFYLWPGSHDALRAWIDGGRLRRDEPPPPPTYTPLTHVDLTPPWAGGRFRVAQARGGTARPLVFGTPWLPGTLPHPIA